ncbi:MAG TPA: ATP-binding protein [Anaerolineae bacterium]|nr:ATP-binding protein [Anaerolineae bacterium]
MNETADPPWEQANQRYLMAALGRVREALASTIARAGDQTTASPTQSAQLALEEARDQLPAPSALDTLCAAFGLSPFERGVLLLCAGLELDSAFAALCARAHGDLRRAYPTFSLALAALPDAHWSALTPVAPLRHWRLIEVGAGEALTTSPLRIDERVLHYLTGVSYLDDRLRALVEPVHAPSELPPSYRALARRIAEGWARAQPGQPQPAILLCGDESAGKRAIAAAACAALGIQLYALRATEIPQTVNEREALARLWEREAVLSGSALLVDCDEMEGTEGARATVSFVEAVRGLLIVSSREPLRARTRAFIRFDVSKPSAAEQKALWHSTLGSVASHLNGQVEAVVTQFNLSLQGIRAASAQIQHSLSDERPAAGASLWEACRVQARPRLDDLAQRIEPAATWDDLVVPDLQRQILREIAAHVRQRSTVYDSWGFAAQGARGLGISALFAGASGTGKTMAAEVLANELRLDLYRIDLSSVVSKYIGETERNLRRVFDAAEEGGAILLFDEADALFGKRSEVKDSHDRYANIEISYLLQRMEAYRGLAILTTNLKNALDPAFMRRIRFVVQFPFPEAAQRADIWRRIFPSDTPTISLDVERLARLNVTGGNIRNIALHAAFLAADEQEPVGMTHLLRAARGEYAKLEKALTDAEIRGWM